MQKAQTYLEIVSQRTAEVRFSGEPCALKGASLELYRYLRQYWLRRLLKTKKKEKQTCKPAVLRPKNERDCRFCREGKGKRIESKHEMPVIGKLVLNGSILMEHDIVGVSVYAVSLEEARALAEADPKVKAGYLTVEAIPWMAVPGSANI